MELLSILLEIAELSRILDGNVIIPKMPAWTFLFGVITAVVVSYITLRVQMAHFDKDIATLRRDTDKNETSIKENNEIYKEIKKELQDINTTLKLKQDKKFVE